MAKYICDKGHIFLFPVTMHMGINELNWVETKECPDPKCRSNNILEYIEPTANVESVFIYELTTGPQTALDALLAQGYVIVNRYAKAYHLEKPKAIAPKGETIAEIIKKVKNPDPDDNQAITEANQP